MRGGSQAHLIEAADGTPYVVKFANNPQHPRIVINEWIASTVLRQLGISTPATAIINLSADFIRENELHIRLGSSREPAACGPHFGSRFAGESAQIVYDQLPTEALLGVANLSHFCGVFVADKWLGNTDHRQSVFIRCPSTDSVGSYEVQMIDNGQVFDGGNWRFEDSPLRGPYAGPVYQHVRGPEDFEPWLSAVAAFPEAVLGEALQQLPRSWLSGNTEAAFVILLGQLMQRRERVRGLIHACHAQPTNPFPNWC